MTNIFYLNVLIMINTLWPQKYTKYRFPQIISLIIEKVRPVTPAEMLQIILADTEKAQR